MTQTETVIELRNVGKAYKGNVLFHDVTITLERGKTYGLVGANGSGKSVLMKIICGFVMPDSGEVWIDPEFLPANRTFPDRFGVTIDGPAYLGGETAEKNLLTLAKIQNRIGKAEVRSALDQVGLPVGSPKKVRTFSLGMKQKLSLAQAFMEDPQVLILDEPFNGLDASSSASLLQLLRDFQNTGKTIIFTSHNKDDIAALADVILEIDGQQILPRDNDQRLIAR
ncbi:ATP-binding cassette domain-containing protein [Cryobacterium sp. M15]|uniref:ATP-binding cassette domain-containing protein n=1 Tax=Cryobacterium sp. M15 TaxID=2048291 RepID=UPI000CE559C0|nr:ATP-binding cassette domain-containing protein [Cryobacterium sp. M15]